MNAFHPRCGDRVVLLNDNTTAIRTIWEFNHGIVLSNAPLTDNTLFQVKIEKVIPSWSGSIEIGVVACEDPAAITLPGSATELTSGAWIVSGTTVLRDGKPSSVEPYGPDLDHLQEGDSVGVMRTDKGELQVYVNNICHGVAATDIPQRVYAVVNLYGKCGQVSIAANAETEMDTSGSGDLFSSLTLSDRLRFYPRHGTLVKLTCGSRTAERIRPLDEFNNGVVMTHRILHSDELFEIRIDRLVDKWSGSIEVGVTTHNPSQLDFPATMTNIRSGTTIMSGCGILTNGKGTRREYGEFNLDELREGDRIGMVRKSSGELHFFINGLDQGVAAENVPPSVWGVVDLYGMTVKVTIVDRDEREEQNLRLRDSLRDEPPQQLKPCTNDSNRLTFHSQCGSHAAVINHGRTVHRPNASDDFNNGVVLTSRPLKPDEMFEVRLDKLVRKWAGSVEIGVTTHSPTSLQFPSTMTNLRSGTWMMTGNGVMHNGCTVVDDYGQNLDKLEEGDRVGVSWKQDGSLHFYVNGEDQGIAAMNLPGNLYGVLDLYGQAAQATLIDSNDYSPESDNSCLSNLTLSSELRFYHIHGKNARVSNNGLTASRPRTLGEFNHAIVITNRALRPGEMFQVQIEMLVDRWSGSIEAGVTTMKPEEIEFPNTMTDMLNTWMLSGSNVMKDGCTLRSGYPCDLDSLTVGTKLGLMRHPSGTLHFYVNGVDQGPACDNVPQNVFAVIDLYGQCSQVSIVPPHSPTTPVLISEPAPPPRLQVTHRFSPCCGKNISLENSSTVAVRTKGYAHGLLFSALPLDNDQMFEICLDEVAPQWSGFLVFGVTTLPISDALQPVNLPPVLSSIVVDTWYISGSDVRKNGNTILPNYCPSLEWLAPGQKLGVKKSSEGVLRFYLEGNDLGVAVTDLPKRVFAVVDLFGRAKKVSVVSKKRAAIGPTSHSLSMSLKMQDSLEIIGEGLSTPTLTRLDDMESVGTMKLKECVDVSPEDMILSENHGRNVELIEGRAGARRVASYNQGLILSNRPLPQGRIFQVRVEKLNPEWACGFAIGVTGARISSTQTPVNALSLKQQTWVVSGDSVFKNGRRVRSGYKLGEVEIAVGTVIGITVDNEHQLHVLVDGQDLGAACGNIHGPVQALIDINGSVEEVSIIGAKPPGLEKADLEVQEKVPQRLGKIEQKLSSSDSYNSGIQQISCNAASSSLQSDTDNFNTQIQQLTLDLQRSQNSCSESGLLAVSPCAPPSAVPRPKVINNRQCTYFRSCLQFRQALGLPDGFFSRDDPSCYCAECYSITDASEAYQVKGDPPRESSLPLGWVKFPLRSHPNASAKMDESWHIVFTGTTTGCIRRILDSGELVSGSLGPGHSNKEHDSHVIFSPSLAYVTDHFAPSYWWSEQCMECTMAVQVLVQPGSYKVGPPSVEGPSQLDPKFARDATEWVPKERGASVLAALLIRLRGAKL